METVNGQGSGMGGQQSWHGDRARARRIADALHKLTGHPPVVDRTRTGATRVSVRVAERADRTQTLAVLRVLGQGDSFGHDRTARWEKVWVEVADRAAAQA
ncbi:hypothetical protein [Kitasatospora cheerisanensis]|uniref:Uncharacterized protein n=1 Tax=Kitasatospora cheerisanensis KCTC 2395 TaxID=1348663 RepID=A0A066YU00_9ACTN|nr:hypothetical protein [Kitasatospora cheerisanensis]KDN81410.1 hypothetical protein KCH_68570 [Kitasatospora cheerisanensis KCTC 2395]